MDYKKLYGLREAPFRLSPDPDFFFPSETHRDALETLLYSIRSGEGFVQITGYPGTGKSMLLRKILQEIKDTVVVGLILHSNIRARDLVHILMLDLKIDISHVKNPSRENLIPLFQEFLLARAREGRQVIIIVDEAQNLPDETLEELRMLSNLETEKAKLLQIILVGQLELEEKITATRLSQLAQRITIRYRLKPLALDETRSYIYHRLEIAAVNREEIPVVFQPGVIKAIHKYTGGIPRLINIVCERCLMAAYIQGGSRITKGHLEKAVLSIDGEPARKSEALVFRPVTCFLLVIFVLTAGLWAYLRVNPDSPLIQRALSTLGAPAATLSGALPQAADSGAREPGSEAPPASDRGVSNSGKGTDRTTASMSVSADLAQPSRLAGEGISRESRKPETAGATAPVVEGKASGEQVVFPIKPMPARGKNLTVAPGWLTLPPGAEQVGVVDIAGNTLVMLKKKGGELFRSGRMTLNWTFPQGVYMAGFSRDGKPFIFHPEIAYLKKIELDNRDFWRLIRVGRGSCVTPIIALDSIAALGRGPKQGADTVRRVVLTWAETWRAMDLEKIMTYFSNVTSIYDVNTDQPLVFSKARMYAIKKNIFRESGFIRVNLSDPVCMINPLDPNVAYAVFHQTYRSKTYRDRGTKVLYFRRLDSDSPKPDWKITGKLWILDSGRRSAGPQVQ